VIPFCGRCGRVFHLLDLSVVVLGAVRRHYVACPVRPVKRKEE
jgi:hypothetical protein